MKKYLFLINNEYVVNTCEGFVPEGFLCELPDDANLDDGKFYRDKSGKWELDEKLKKDEDDKKKKIKGIAEAKEYLTQTNWMIFRHLEQKAIGVKTTLSDEEYLVLAQEREEKRDIIAGKG